MVFDATGGAPLYLNLLRRLTAAMAAAAVPAVAPAAPVVLEDVWPRMLLHREVADIYYNIGEQVIKHMSENKVAADSYLEFLTAAVAGRPSLQHAAQAFVYDHRYYYRTENNSFSCSSGFARDATLEAIRDTGRPLHIVQSEALSDALFDANTPPAQRGWIAEQYVLGKVRHFGLQLSGLVRNPAALVGITAVLPDYFHVFLQQLGPADSGSHCVSLYQPRLSNFPHVDAVLRIHPQQFAHAGGGAGANAIRRVLNYFLPAAGPPAVPANILTEKATVAKLAALANVCARTIIIGVQVTIANPMGHPNARQQFVTQAAAANSIWTANIPVGTVEYHFHWIVRKALIPALSIRQYGAAGAMPAHCESYSALEDYMDSDTPIP